MHARRALLYMPGHDRHKIEKALTLQVDCICMDLEDGVAPNRKDAARRGIATALRELDFGSSEKLVRINPAGSGLEQADLEAVLPHHPDGIVLPKVESLEQLNWLAGQIETMELARGWPINAVRLLAIVETARGLLALKEIACHKRLDALIFGAEDYAASIGAARSGEAWEVFTARSMTVMHARAFGLQAVDMVNIDFRDLQALRREATFGAGLGYTGKQVIHPAQVAPVQEAFTPDEDSIRAAEALLETFHANQAAGRGAYGVDGKLVDMPLVRAAEGVLERARLAGRL